jgi:hypothetical protein
MNTILSFGLMMITALGFVGQETKSQDPQVEVLSVSCTQIRRANVDLSADSFPTAFPDAENARTSRPTTVNGQPIVSQSERDPRTSVEKRSDRMGNVESELGRNAKNATLYEYTAKIRNNSAKTITAVYWDFRAGDEADQRNISVRHFRCTENIKPNASRSLKATITGPPFRTIRAGANDKSVPQKAVIGRLEFTDGSSWQLSAWEAGSSVKEPGAARHTCEELH